MTSLALRDAATTLAELFRGYGLMLGSVVLASPALKPLARPKIVLFGQQKPRRREPPVQLCSRWAKAKPRG